MEKISTSAELKNAILLLEIDRDYKGLLLKEQFYATTEKLKPASMVRTIMDDISSSPYLLDNFLSTSAGLVSGFLSRKMFVGASGNIVRKVLGSFLQFGITNVVAKNPETIKTVVRAIAQYFVRRKTLNSQKP
jgi:hypothetical protein